MNKSVILDCRHLWKLYGAGAEALLEGGQTPDAAALNFRFTEAEVQQLLGKYREQSGLISYSRFCNNVDTVFTDSVDPISVIENSKSTANFTDEEKGELLALLSIIRT